MKVLIIGRGVVGTIYGWALSRAGIDVTHVVRREGFLPDDRLDLLDLRPDRPKRTLATYSPNTVRRIAPSDRFDVVIIATKHYQVIEAIQQYAPDAPGTCSPQTGMEQRRSTGSCPGHQLFWGYAKASGGMDRNGVLVATVDPAVRLGSLEGSDPRRFKAVAEMFQRAGFILDVKANIIEWLWLHHALNAGRVGVCLWAGGIAEATLAR